MAKAVLLTARICQGVYNFNEYCTCFCFLQVPGKPNYLSRDTVTASPRLEVQVKSWHQKN